MNVETKDGITIVRLEGELNLAAYERLRAPLHALYDQHGAKVILDLARVSFIGSVGWGLLLSVLHRSRRQGGQLKLLYLPEHLTVVFLVLSLERVFEVFDDEEIALKSYRPNLHEALEQ